MKTYNCLYALVAFVIIGCSKSDTGDAGDQQQKSVAADYVALLKKGNTLSVQLINANKETITLNPAESSLPENKLPQLTAVRGTTFFQYHKKDDCGGKITMHDFATDQMEVIDLFDDLNDCQLTANAIAFSESSLYVAYDLEIDSSTSEYRVRVIDLNSVDFSFEDIPLGKKPLGLALANNRLFILTIDLEITDENFLYVLDLDSNELVHEIKLGLRARRIFRNMDDDIIISYDNLHSTLNSSTMALVYTNYEPGKEPKFSAGTTDHFDVEGRLYYVVDPGTKSVYPSVPAVYDFSKNLMILYTLENILTDAQRNFEFEIETTTAVNYDKGNNRILIGYKKVDVETGGLLRFEPAADGSFIDLDNIDLDGVPYEILVD